MNNGRSISCGLSIVIAVSALWFAEGATNNGKVIRTFSGLGEELLNVLSFIERQVGWSTHVFYSILYSFVGLFLWVFRCLHSDGSILFPVPDSPEVAGSGKRSLTRALKCRQYIAARFKSLHPDTQECNT